MKFEIVEAYEFRKKTDEKPLGWSIHIYLLDIEMDIRGLVLIKLKNGWFLKMPTLKNYDIEDRKLITYPLISFLDKDKTRNFIAEIKEKAIAYVEEKIAQEMIEKEKNQKTGLK